MDFETARRVLIVASAERADAAGEVVPLDLRRAATDAAPDLGEAGEGVSFSPSEEAFLAARADQVLAATGLDQGQGSGGRSPGCWVLGIASVAGFLSKGLDASGVVNILAFPLLALMVWNMAVYLITAIRGVSGRPLQPALPRGRFGRPAGEDAFSKTYLQVMAPSVAARTGALFHLGAAALGLGAVAGMYWDGLVRDYQATWESTFLSAGQVRGILSVALAPATWLPGLALPEVAGIEAIRRPGGEGAAEWIHRYAIAASAVVIIPRLVLASRAKLKAASLARSLPVREVAPGYFQTLFDEKRGVRSVARVVPHRVELDPSARDSLRARLHDRWGGALWVDFLDAVPYGEEEEFAGRASELRGADHIAVVCGLSATPEDESQGRLLRAVRAAAGGGEVLLALDDAGFTGRFGEARAGERRAAWRKLAADCEVELLNGST